MAKNLPVAIIGAGAGGLPAAVALAENGFKVLVIERGREIASSEFVSNRYDYELASSPWRDYSSEWDGPVELQRGVGVGGSTLYFQAVSQMPAPGILAKWGLPEERIVKVADDVKAFIKIAGENQRPHPLNQVSKQLVAGAQKSSWKVRPAPVAILSEPNENRPACNYCGLCAYGCRPGDKNSVNNTWLPRAKRTGLVEVLSESIVEYIELDDSKRASALRIKEGKRNYTLPVAAVVVAAGAMETPYLLKSSKQASAPSGIGNQHVGRNLIGSVWHSLLVALPSSDGQGYAGVPIDIVVEEFAERGILLFQGRNLAGIAGPISAARFYTQAFGIKNMREWMRSEYSNLAGLAGLAESTVAFEDGLIASKDKKRYIKRLQQKDYALLKEMRGYLHHWADQSKATILNELGSFKSPFVGAMFRGTCRVGNSPKDSAVDPSGKLWGHENIVVSDASVLSTGLIANPSLPIQVLSSYFGQQLAETLRVA